MQNSSIFQISNANSKHFIFSIIGIFLIPIVLICFAISYYCYKRYLNTKFKQEKDIDQISIIKRNSIENESSVKYK